MISKTAGHSRLQDRCSSIEKVLVFRALNLGDMLCAVPALRALRAGLHQARITLAGLPWARQFAVRFRRYIDDFVEFPGYPGLPEQLYRPDVVASFMKEMHLRRYDLAIQMHGSGTISNAFIASVGARFSAGYYPPGQTAPEQEWFYPYPEHLSEVERNLFLVRQLGFPVLGDQLEFPIMDQDARDLSFSTELRTLRPGTYVCIHPGASVREKCWPVEQFAAVAASLRQRGQKVVITGNRKESDLAIRIAETTGSAAVIDSASLDLSLGSLALLVRDARLLVCNDTGVSHLASALAVPSVVVFTTADPVRWAPLERARHRAVGGKGSSPSLQEVLKEVNFLLDE